MTNDKKIEMEFGFGLEDHAYVFSLMFFHKKYLAGMLGNLPRGIFFASFLVGFSGFKSYWFSQPKICVFLFFRICYQSFRFDKA